jgi:hypothetical protein
LGASPADIQAEKKEMKSGGESGCRGKPFHGD